MNGGNSSVFKKNSVSCTTHPNENSGATGVFIAKVTYHEKQRQFDVRYRRYYTAG